MPLKPSGQTPTSSPPRSIRSASSLQARVAPPLRASVLTRGIWKTRSAPSGRRNRPVWSWIDDHRHQAVDRDGAGVVGDDEGAAVGGDVLDAADLDAEPLLGDRAQRGHEEALGDLLVEAVLVDGVVAGDPAAQEGQEAGQLRLPLLAEHLAGGVLEGREPVAGRDAAARARRSSRAAWRGRARPWRLGSPPARASTRRSAAAAACGVAWASARDVGRGRRLRAGGLAGAGREAAGGGRRLLPPCRGPGRPRVPIGMISASPMVGSLQPGGRRLVGPAGSRSSSARRAPAPRGRRSAAAARRSRRTPRRS